MPTLRVSLVVDLDGSPVSGFPSTLVVQAEVAQGLDHEQGDATTATLLDTAIGTLRALVLRADKTVSLQLNGSANVVTLAPGGLLLLLNVTQPGDKAGVLNTITNNSGEPTQVKGVALGSP